MSALERMLKWHLVSYRIYLNCEHERQWQLPQLDVGAGVRLVRLFHLNELKVVTGILGQFTGSRQFAYQWRELLVAPSVVVQLCTHGQPTGITSRHDASRCAGLIWYTSFLYRYSSTTTIQFPSPFMATVYKPSLVYLGFLNFLSSFLFPLFLPFAFPSLPTPTYLPPLFALI